MVLKIDFDCNQSNIVMTGLLHNSMRVLSTLLTYADKWHERLMSLEGMSPVFFFHLSDKKNAFEKVCKVFSWLTILLLFIILLSYLVRN